MGLMLTKSIRKTLYSEKRKLKQRLAVGDLFTLSEEPLEERLRRVVHAINKRNRGDDLTEEELEGLRSWACEQAGIDLTDSVSIEDL